MRTLLRSLIVMLCVVGCTSKPTPEATASSAPSPTKPTATLTPTTPPPTYTLTPSSTPTPTPTPPFTLDSDAILELGRGSILASAFSPDLQYLAVVSKAGITVYAGETLTEVWFQPVEHPNILFHLVYRDRSTDIGWKADSQAFTTVYHDTLTTWDASTGEIIKEAKLPFNMARAEFNPSGTLLAIFPDNGDEVGDIYIWDVEANEYKHVIRQTSDDVMEWTSDNTIVVSWRSLWNVESGIETQLQFESSEVSGISGIGWSVAISSDGSKYAEGLVYQGAGGLELVDSGVNEGAIKVWDMKTGDFIGAWETPMSPDWMVFSPDGNEIGFASRDHLLIRFYNIWTGQLTRTLVGTGFLALSPDRSLLMVTSRDGVTLMDARTGQPRGSVGGYSYEAIDVAFSGDGSLIASNSMSRVNLWDGNTGAFLRAFAPSRLDAGISLSADGKLLAIGMAYPEVWDTQTGQRIAVLNNGMRRLYPHSLVVFAPDGRTLAATAGNFDEYEYWDRLGTSGNEGYVGDGDRIVLWDAQTGTLIKTLRIGAPITAVAWSPRGDAIAVEWIDNEAVEVYDYYGAKNVGIWDVSSGEQITNERIFNTYENLPTDELAWLPFDTGFAKFGIDSIRTWPLEREAIAGSNLMFDSATEMAFASNGAYLLVARDESIDVYDTFTGEFMGNLDVSLGEQNQIVSIAVSPDSRYLLVGTWRTVLRIPLNFQP